jgi:peptide/nickel transport system substrate-binding protein
MKMSKRNIGITTAMFLLALSLFFVDAGLLGAAEQKSTPKQPPAPRYGGTMRIYHTTSDAISIGYPAKLLRNSNRFASPAVETLFRSDKTGKPIPWLATGYKNDVKKNAIIITLRKDIKFHDGTDFNAEAVKWNLEECMAAKTGGTENFKSIDVVDNYAVQINLSEWDSTVLSNLAMTVGLMVSPTACKKNGAEWAAKNPVGTGPFQFVSWEKGIRISYKKFPSYWIKGKPYLDKVEFVIIDDTNTQEMSFKAGEAELIDSMFPVDLPGLEKRGYNIVRGRPGSGAYGMIPDSANPASPFANLKVRQAVQYAIDTNAIIKGVFQCENEAANQYVSKTHWGYNKKVIGYPYNPAKAKKLLAEAGYPNGFKTTIYASNVAMVNKPWIAVQQFLKEVGIDAQMELIPQPRLVEMAYGGKWQGLLPTSISPNPDVVVPLSQKYAGNGNYTQMLLPDDYLKAVQKTLTAPTMESKQKYVQEVMKLLVDKYCLMIFMFCPSEYAISQTYIHNHGFMDTPNTAIWTPEEAWMDK